MGDGHASRAAARGCGEPEALRDGQARAGWGLDRGVPRTGGISPCAAAACDHVRPFSRLDSLECGRSFYTQICYPVYFAFIRGLSGTSSHAVSRSAVPRLNERPNAQQRNNQPRVPYNATLLPTHKDWERRRSAVTIIGGLQATTRPSSNAAADQIPPLRSAFAVEHRAQGHTPDGRRLNSCLLACMWQAYTLPQTPHDLACVVLAVTWYRAHGPIGLDDRRIGSGGPIRSRHSWVSSRQHPRPLTRSPDSRALSIDSLVVDVNLREPKPSRLRRICLGRRVLGRLVYCHG